MEATNTPSTEEKKTPSVEKAQSLLISVEKIKAVASREEMKSDGGGTGRSDTNDNQNNPLEIHCRDGRVKRWGVATWDGFCSSPRRPGPLSVEEFENFALHIAGRDNHFAAVQMPIGLGHSTLLHDYFLRRGPLYEAELLGKDVYASAPLNGGALPGALDTAFMALFPDAVTPAKACLQFAASAPAVTTVIAGSRTPAQLAEAHSVSKLPALEESAFRDILSLLN